MAVETLLERESAHEIVDVVDLGLLDKPAHLDLPRVRGETSGQRTDHLFVGGELVEIVVTFGDLFVSQGTIEGVRLVAPGGVEPLPRGRQGPAIGRRPGAAGGPRQGPKTG